MDNIVFLTKLRDGFTQLKHPDTSRAVEHLDRVIKELREHRLRFSRENYQHPLYHTPDDDNGISAHNRWFAGDE